MADFQKRWAAYQRDVIPKGASLTQVGETKQAFYGGAWALYCLMLGTKGEAEMTAQWKDFQGEFERYCREECMGPEIH